MATELRRRFENYLTLRRFSPKTKSAYLAAVKGLANHFNTSPDKLEIEKIQEYLVYLIRIRKLAWSSVNVTLCALICFYGKFLNREDLRLCIPPRPRQRKLPKILTRDQVHQLIRASRDIRHRALLMMTYGSGLRVSEVVRLKPHHIEAERMMVRVEQGKGRKDRYTLLSQTALDTLRDYYRAFFPKPYLFFGKDKNKPMPIATAQKIYRKSKKAAGLTTGQGIHTLRHCFASHLLEQGIDIYLIKRYLGHSAIQTTMIYLHVVPGRLQQVKSPLDRRYEKRNLTPETCNG